MANKILINTESNTGDTNRKAFNQLNHRIMNKKYMKNKILYNVFNTEKIWLDDTSGFIAFIGNYYSELTNTEEKLLIAWIKRNVKSSRGKLFLHIQGYVWELNI